MQFLQNLEYEGPEVSLLDEEKQSHIFRIEYHLQNIFLLDNILHELLL